MKYRRLPGVRIPDNPPALFDEVVNTLHEKMKCYLIKYGLIEIIGEGIAQEITLILMTLEKHG